jgi:hypothetical protein
MKNTAVQTGEGSAPRGITLSGQHLVDVLVLLNQLKRIANDSEVIHCGALSDINDDETIRDMINAAHFAVNHQPTTPTLVPRRQTLHETVRRRRARIRMGHVVHRRP